MVAMIVTAALIVPCLVNTVAADGHSDEVHDGAPAAPPPPIPAPAPRPAAAPAPRPAAALAPRPAAISPSTTAPVPRQPAVATQTTAATPRPAPAPAPSPAPRRLVELPKLNRDQPPPSPAKTITQMSDENVASEERSSVEYKTRLAGAPGGGEMLVPYAPTLSKKNKDGQKKRMFDNAEEAIHDIAFGYYAAKDAYERFKKMH